MDYAVTFARHFVRLVSLLLHEPENIEEQKATLRSLVAVSHDGPVTLAVHDWRLEANGQPIRDSMSGAAETASRLCGHGVSGLSVDTNAAPADLVGVSRILAGVPKAGDHGEAARARLDRLGARTVRFLTEIPPVPDVDSAPADERLVQGEASLFMHFTAPVVRRENVEQLLAELDAARDADDVTRLLDDLVTLAENAARDGKSDTVAEVFRGIMSRETRASGVETKRAYVMTLRRMARPTLLGHVAILLPRNRERLEDHVDVLIRAGEDGAEALIDQLTQAQTTDERRIYFDVLLRLHAGVPALMHMLGDHRWFVARNAADLLGRMKAVAAEPQLILMLRHADDRVRRAAASALLRLGTPAALRAVHEAIHDKSPEVRAQAVTAMAARPTAQTADTLVRALDEESDATVQSAILAALGRVATADAVARLIRAAEPDGRIFRRKTVQFRAAAVGALGEARTAAAMDALRGLQSDRDREVRDAAMKALARSRAPGPSRVSEP